MINENNYRKRRIDTRKLVLTGMFAALAYVCMLVIHIKVQFLTFDAKDAVLAIGAMLLNPMLGLIMSFIVAFVEMITVSDTGLYGFIMNFLSSAVFSATVSLIYYKKRNMKRAIIGLLAAVVATTAVMLLANLFITPFYMSVPRKVVEDLIPTLLLPFNLVKSMLNASLVLVFYKQISIALKSVIKGNKKHELENTKENNTRPLGKKSYLLLGIGAVLVIAFVLIMIFGLGGSFEFFK